MRPLVIHPLKLLVMLGLLAITVTAQPMPKPKRLRAPATIRGLVGGEANDTYVVHVGKGRQLTVELSWKKEDDNWASFGMGSSPDLEPVTFGKEYNKGRKWIGKVPKSGDYFIEVVAHPRAEYVLRVRIN